MSDKLESFERAFFSGMSGCRRQCDCGREFYDNANEYGWEDGELEALHANKNATPIDYSVGTLIYQGREYCVDCDCWKEDAKKTIAFFDHYSRQIAEFFKLEKKRKQLEAEAAPQIEL